MNQHLHNHIRPLCRLVGTGFSQSLGARLTRVPVPGAPAVRPWGLTPVLQPGLLCVWMRTAWQGWGVTRRCDGLECQHPGSAAP